jgi:hypothetical protein
MYNPFTLADIREVEILEANVAHEAQCIYVNEKLRRGRTLEQVADKVRQGKVAEQWLIENHAFTQARLKFHDLMNADREYVEVKAYSYGDIFMDFVVKDLIKYRDSTWSKAKWYILFNCIDGIYYHKATIKIK